MSIKRKCIFHFPNPLNENGTSGSSIRPVKMLNALRNIGYEVDIISGYSNEREQNIKRIKEKIINGESYDFVYSESSTMPTMLTDKNHIPKKFNMDFRFFRFCKNNDIPIGLFYRDVQWKLPIYKENVSGIKRWVAFRFYNYDLRQYKRYLTCMFLPTVSMSKYINKKYLIGNLVELPPGADCCNYSEMKLTSDGSTLRLLYVGGIGELYRFDELLRAVADMEDIIFTICCRENEWIAFSKQYEDYLASNIKVVHKSGDELKTLYNQCDVCLAVFCPRDYTKIAMPVKIFEYMSYCKPVIANVNTAYGDFVSKNKIGWSVEYDADKIRDLLVYIKSNPKEVVDKTKEIAIQLENHTWERRAEKVKEILTKRG